MSSSTSDEEPRSKEKPTKVARTDGAGATKTRKQRRKAPKLTQRSQRELRTIPSQKKLQKQKGASKEMGMQTQGRRRCIALTETKPKTEQQLHAWAEGTDEATARGTQTREATAQTMARRRVWVRAEDVNELLEEEERIRSFLRGMAEESSRQQELQIMDLQAADQVPTQPYLLCDREIQALTEEDIQARNWDDARIRRPMEESWRRPNMEGIEMIQEHERNEEEEEALLLVAAEGEEWLRAEAEWAAQVGEESQRRVEDETQHDDSYQDGEQYEAQR